MIDVKWKTCNDTRLGRNLSLAWWRRSLRFSKAPLGKTRQTALSGRTGS